MENDVAPAAEQITILHIFPSFGYGGQQARLADIVKGLRREFSHCIVALDDDLSARVLFSDDAPVEFRTIKSRKSSIASIHNLRRLEALMYEIKPDLLCTYNWGSMEAVLANRLRQKNPHLHFEDGFGPGESPECQPRRRVVARRMLLARSTIVTPSHTLENVARSLWKLPSDNVLRIENGIVLERFQPPPSNIHKQLIVGTVGALRREKNIPRMIRAFSNADRNKTAQLTIVGAGPEQAVIATAIKDSNASDRIILAGSTRMPEKFYSEFDIFVLSSDTEQAPLTLMEAMASGLPVVATNVGDIERMVSDENRAFITTLGDEEAFARALAHLLQNPDVRATLGNANWRKARANFDGARMVDRHRQLYLDKTGGHD